MGFPVKTLSDVIRNIGEIEERTKPKSYAFVLYKKEHKDIREYILNNFNHLHSLSRDTVLFILDRPEKWLQRRDINYYRNTMGREYMPEHDDIEAEIAAKYFEIPKEELPAVVLFNSLKNSEWVILSLKDFNKRKYDEFFGTLFEHLNELGNIKDISYLTDWLKDNIIGTLTFGFLSTPLSALRQLFSDISYRTVGKRGRDENIKEMFDKILEEIKLSRDENKQYFNKLSEKLTQIQKDLKDYKEDLKIKLNKLAKQKESHLAEMQYEKLLYKYDETLWTSSVKIAEESKEEIDTEILNLSFLENYERESTEMILSGLSVYRIVKMGHETYFDYSLVAVGFWKAVENELNIILIDTLRLIRDFISAIPSCGFAVKAGQCKIFAGYKRDQEYYVDINHQYERKFSPVMFGDMIKISEHWKKNDYLAVIEKIKKEMKTVSDMNAFMTDFVNNFKKIVYDFRNACSHTEKMNEPQFIEMKNILMSDNGLYFQISELKKSIYKVVN